MVMSRYQRESYLRQHRDGAGIPVDRFELTERGRVRCVLCHREGVRGHVGPVEPPVAVWRPFAPWQVACLPDHPWTCSCGRVFPRYVNLWRHIGADRPTGWGRQSEHHVVDRCAWPQPSE